MSRGEEVLPEWAPEVRAKFQAYPPAVRVKLEGLRRLVLETGAELEPAPSIEETLKWGEPSYISPRGSTIRMDWKPRAPQQYALYFNCNTSLVETFRHVYGDLFRYEKNRALIFDLEAELPVEALKDCIEMALNYHQLKGQPFLGR